MVGCTCNRRDNGKQSLNSWLLRKLLKKVGHVDEVKLFPRLVSKGLGKEAAAVSDAVCMVLSVVEGDPELGVIVTVVTSGREAAEAEEEDEADSSCRLSRCIRGRGGGGLRSNKSSPGNISAAPYTSPAFADRQRTNRQNRMVMDMLREKLVKDLVIDPWREGRL